MSRVAARLLRERNSQDLWCATRFRLTEWRCKDSTAGLSQQAGEAGGSLAWEAPGRVGAAPTTTGRSGTARRAGSGKQGRTVQRAVNQWWNPRKRRAGSNLVDGGRPAAHAEHGPSMVRGDSGGHSLCARGGHEEGLRRTRGEAAGEKLDTAPADRHMVNVGSARMPPFPPHGQWGGGQARRRLMASGRGGAPVVVRGQESCLHGEGGQRVRSRGTGRPGGRR